MKLLTIVILIVSFIQFRIYRKQKQRLARDFIVLSILYASTLGIVIIDMLSKNGPVGAIISWFQPISDWVYHMLGG